MYYLNTTEEKKLFIKFLFIIIIDELFNCDEWELMMMWWRCCCCVDDNVVLDHRQFRGDTYQAQRHTNGEGQVKTPIEGTVSHSVLNNINI